MPSFDVSRRRKRRSLRLVFQLPGGFKPHSSMGTDVPSDVPSSIRQNQPVWWAYHGIFHGSYWKHFCHVPVDQNKSNIQSRYRQRGFPKRFLIHVKIISRKSLDVLSQHFTTTSFIQFLVGSFSPSPGLVRGRFDSGQPSRVSTWHKIMTQGKSRSKMSIGLSISKIPLRIDYQWLQWRNIWNEVSKWNTSIKTRRVPAITSLEMFFHAGFPLKTLKTHTECFGKMSMLVRMLLSPPYCPNKPGKQQQNRMTIWSTVQQFAGTGNWPSFPSHFHPQLRCVW